MRNLQARGTLNRRAKAVIFGLPIAIILVLSSIQVTNANNLRSSYPIGADYATTPEASSSESISKKLLSWPFSHDPNDVDNQSAYPLGKSIPRALANFNEKQPVFSFTRKGGAAERYQKRQLANNGRQLAETEEAHVDEEHKDDHGADTHGDGHDAHDAAHEMVVHVTYEDICECIHLCLQIVLHMSCVHLVISIPVH